jgi:hypothetical protein
MIGHFDGSVFQGSNEYNCQWIYQKPRNIPGWDEWEDITHAPHVYKFPEVVALLGAYPDDPLDLGAEM